MRPKRCSQRIARWHIALDLVRKCIRIISHNRIPSTLKAWPDELRFHIDICEALDLIYNVLNAVLSGFSALICFTLV